MIMITLIDYGIGNLRSLEKAFEAVGVKVLRTDDPARIAEAERIVLPGVGAFGACMDEVRLRGLVVPILDAVSRNVPFLGVCVGLQMLFDVGLEMGTHPGLGILPGQVVRFTDDLAEEVDTPDGPVLHRLKVPHIGWTPITTASPSPLLEGLPERTHFYFVHSYYVRPERPEHTLATAHYGHSYTAIAGRDRLFGVQFHPEKSQQAGLRLLRNFAALV